MRYKKLALANDAAINPYKLYQDLMRLCAEFDVKATKLEKLAGIADKCVISNNDDAESVSMAVRSAVEGERFAKSIGFPQYAKEFATIRDALARIEKKLRVKG